MDTLSTKRILFVAANPHFVRIFLRDQIRMLLEEGCEVMVLCSPEGGAQTLESEVGCVVTCIKIARSIDLLSDLKSLAQVYRTMRDWRPAIVHTHTPKAGLIGSLAAWCARVPVRVHTLHGLRSETLHGARRFIVEAMERLTSVCSTHGLSVSTSLRRAAIHRGICTPKKLRVLGFGSCAGVPTERFRRAGHRERAAIFRAGTGIDEKELLITYLGRIAQDKGVHVLAAAWTSVRESCPRARLLIAGPKDATDPCDASVLHTLANDTRVVFYPHLIEDVAPLLAASDLFVQPSFREGLGVSALEASAMRVPVIASRVTGLVDAVDEGRTGLLVEADDAMELAGKIEMLLNTPRLRSTMGKEGVRFVERRFDRRLVLKNTLAFYRELLVPRAAQSTGRRLAEAAIACALLILLSPLFLMVSLVILVAMGRPIFFRQQRSGFAGRSFMLAKFRTMRVPQPHESTLGSDDQRTSLLGHWLRTLSLDELPQLWNIVRGDMSFIGPRPLLVGYMPRYSGFERRRHEVRPGITGWAQVNGRNDMSWQRKFALDVWYVDHRSVGLDLKITWMTLRRLLKPQGIVPSGQPAMPEFMGTTPQQQH